MTDFGPTMAAVYRDHDTSLAAMARLDTYRDTLRGLAITVVTAAIGIGVANESKVPMLGAIPIVFALTWGDMRAGSDLIAAEARARILETVVRVYITYQSEVGGDNELDARENLQDRIDTYEYGSRYLNHPFGPAETTMRCLRYSPWFTIVYAVLLAVLAACAFTVN